MFAASGTVEELLSTQTALLGRVLDRLTILEQKFDGLQADININKEKSFQLKFPIENSSRFDLKQLRVDRKLVMACYMHHYDEILLAFEEGANLNAEVEFGSETYAPNSDWDRMVAADTREDDYKFGPDDNHIYGSYTPLLAAIECPLGETGDMVTNMIIRMGANVNARNSQGETAVMIACKRTLTEPLNLLLERNAVLDYYSKCGETALHYACKAKYHEWSYRGCIGALLDANVDVNLKVKKQEWGSGIETGKTALHFVCAARSIDAIKLILARGADVNALSEFGESPLTEACGERFGSLLSNEHLQRATPAEIVALLLQAGGSARSNAVFKATRTTALHKAAMYGDFEACKLLVSRGADLFAKDSNGAKPLTIYATYQSYKHPVAKYDAATHTQAFRKELPMADEIKSSHCEILVELHTAFQSAPLLEALQGGRILHSYKTACLSPEEESLRWARQQALAVNCAKLSVLYNRDLVVFIRGWL